MFLDKEAGKNISFAMTNHRTCVARDHVVLASGENLTEEYAATIMAEHSSQIRYLVDLRRK